MANKPTLIDKINAIDKACYGGLSICHYYKWDVSSFNTSKSPLRNHGPFEAGRPHKNVSSHTFEGAINKAYKRIKDKRIKEATSEEA